MLFRHLNECFNHALPVGRRLTRYKHWFQDENVATGRIVDETLVIAMFRNPFEWVEAMRKRVSELFHTRTERELLISFVYRVPFLTNDDFSATSCI